MYQCVSLCFLAFPETNLGLVTCSGRASVLCHFWEEQLENWGTCSGDAALRQKSDAKARSHVYEE